MKVAVLISGGVDSSVALNLLKKEGHDLTAFYLKIWLEDEMSYMGECPWKEDLAYVRTICQKLDVPLEVVNMQKEYWDNVVSYTISEARAGRTPNPDIFCNQRVKFGHFYKKIDQSYEKVATGHYANVEERDGKFFLEKAPDPVKDQTYFLAHLSQDQLKKAMFPIGKYKKEKVREFAQEFDLPNKDRRDSQGICFLGKIPFREFIKHHLGEKPGDFVNQETGEKVGEHLGYWFYTIGQRQGLSLGGGPWFVIDKDVTKNIVYLAQGYSPDEVYKEELEVTNFNWITEKFEEGEYKWDVKIRHGSAIHPCKVKFMNKNCVQVKLEEKVHGVAPGQYAVFYDGDICLGCGMIA